MKPVWIDVALPMIAFQLAITSEDEIEPPLTLKSPVSNVAVGLSRVHITGVRPIAVAMARTRSLYAVVHQYSHLTIIDQRGGQRKVHHVLDVSVGRAEGVRSNASNIFYDLLRPSKLSDNLLICQCRERGMAPCMHTNLVPGHVFHLQGVRLLKDSRSDCEERRLEVVGVKILQQVWRVEGRAIVVRQTPGKLIRAGRDVSITRATTASPPATRRVRCSRGVCRTGGSSHSDTNVWD